MRKAKKPLMSLREAAVFLYAHRCLTKAEINRVRDRITKHDNEPNACTVMCMLDRPGVEDARKDRAARCHECKGEGWIKVPGGLKMLCIHRGVE